MSGSRVTSVSTAAEIARVARLVGIPRRALPAYLELAGAEAGALAELDLEDGRPALVLSRAPGLHLGEWRRRLGRIPTDAAVQATIAACKVMGEAHRSGLVHTAIRPSHVLRDVRGNIHIVDWRHAVPAGAVASGPPSPSRIRDSLTVFTCG